MKTAQAKFISAFLIALFLFASCSQNENQNSQSANSVQTPGASNEYANSDLPKDDIEELEKTIKLPLRPEDAIWRADNKKFLAVLKFSAEQANQIVQQAEKYKPAAEAQIDAENWFPAELIAQSQLSGDESLKGISYAANDFLQSPFTDGKITRVTETDFFVLELQENK